MSGTVEQILARAEKLDNLKKFVVENSEVSLPEAIEKFYGPDIKTDWKFNYLMRVTTLARMHPHRVHR